MDIEIGDPVTITGNPYEYVVIGQLPEGFLMVKDDEDEIGMVHESLVTRIDKEKVSI